MRSPAKWRTKPDRRQTEAEKEVEPFRYNKRWQLVSANSLYSETQNLSSAAPALPKPQPVLALTSSRPSRPPQPWGKHPHSAQPSKQRQRTSSSEAPEAWQASASSKASTHRLARASSNDQACSKSTGHPSNRNSDGQSTSATKHTARNSRTCRTVCARPPTKAQRDAMRRTLIDMSGPSVAFRPGTSPRFVGQYSGRSEAQSEAQELRGMA